MFYSCILFDLSLLTLNFDTVNLVRFLGYSSSIFLAVFTLKSHHFVLYKDIFLQRNMSACCENCAFSNLMSMDRLGLLKQNDKKQFVLAVAMPWSLGLVSKSGFFAVFTIYICKKFNADFYNQEL